MKINKTSIQKVLSQANIAFEYNNDDPQLQDPCFDLHGEYEGIQISFARGTALVCTELGNGCLADEFVHDAYELLAALKKCVLWRDTNKAKIVSHPHIRNRFAIVDLYGGYLKNAHGAVCSFKSRCDAAQHLVPVQG